MKGLLDRLARRCRCQISDLSRRLESVGCLVQEAGKAAPPERREGMERWNVKEECGMSCRNP